MKNRTNGFLSKENIDHDSEQFDYITEIHNYLWKFVRTQIPNANGKLSDFVDDALVVAGMEIESNKEEAGAKLRSRKIWKVTIEYSIQTIVDYKDKSYQTPEIRIANCNVFCIDQIYITKSRLKQHFKNKIIKSIQVHGEGSFVVPFNVIELQKSTNVRIPRI